jgi:hypothetical protein
VISDRLEASSPSPATGTKTSEPSFNSFITSNSVSQPMPMPSCTSAFMVRVLLTSAIPRTCPVMFACHSLSSMRRSERFSLGMIIG